MCYLSYDSAKLQKKYGYTKFFRENLQDNITF
jgi:hypothetical protein